MKLAALLMFLAFFVLSFAESQASPSPSPTEIPPPALPSVDATSSTAFAIVNHETAPLGFAILVLLVIGVFLDKFVKNRQ